MAGRREFSRSPGRAPTGSAAGIIVPACFGSDCFSLPSYEKTMKISEYLTPGLIKLDLVSETKEELFPEMVQLFVRNGLIRNADEAVRVLEEREEKMSTGVGNGIGLPHGKLPEAATSLLALGISRKGIDYDSLDGAPVYIVITIFANPDNPAQHIEVLAEISRLFAIPEFAQRIRGARSADEVLSIIAAQE